MSHWEIYEQMWRLSGDKDEPLTDASEANDFLVEHTVEQFQMISKELTDRTVALSAERQALQAHLQKYHDAVILAYSAAIAGQMDEVKRHLKRVVEL